MIILTADSNILVLRGKGFWSASASLIEYETGCWFLRFIPKDTGGLAPVKVEVSPVFADSDDLPGLLALSVFMLLPAEAVFGR
jgi:hypothetical protein